MSRWFIIFGALNGFLSVALGAFAAHGLKARVTPDLLETFQTGARYEMYHGLALILVGVLLRLFPEQGLLNGAGWAFLTGIIIFCGSLYLIVFTGVRSFGALAPIGGLSFMAGWVLLLIAFIRLRG